MVHSSQPLLDVLERQDAEKAQSAVASQEKEAVEDTLSTEEQPPIRYIGEAFRTYLVAERGDSLFVIDKHAAHERILYRQLCENARQDAQMLLEPVTAALSREEYEVLLPELERLREAGFEIEDFGGTLLVRALPMMLTGEDVSALLQEIAGGFLSGKREISMDKLDWIYHSVACRAAIKAGNRNSPEEMAACCRTAAFAIVRTVVRFALN
jgi:DNA mismatch repair protein MutL